MQPGFPLTILIVLTLVLRHITSFVLVDTVLMKFGYCVNDKVLSRIDYGYFREGETFV